jgi:hypothetical protein
MKVEMLNAGWFTSAAGIWRRDDDLERQVRFPVPAYVIEAGEERILVDTGLHPAAVEDAPRHYNQPDALALFELELDEGIAEQVDLTTITKAVLTHLHFDHAGGLALLPPSVPVFVQRREWEAGQDADAVARNFYLPLDYGAIAEQVALVDGDHDLLGDTRLAISRSASVSGSSSVPTSPTTRPDSTTADSPCSPTTSPRRQHRPTACSRSARPEPSFARATIPPFSFPVPCLCDERRDPPSTRISRSLRGLSPRSLDRLGVSAVAGARPGADRDPVGLVHRRCQGTLESLAVPSMGFGGAAHVEVDQLVQERLPDVAGTNSGIGGD